MPKFIREYVHCLMDNNLIGKTGFFADDAVSLKEFAERGALMCQGRVSGSKDACNSYPFLREDNQTRYKFFYYDPYWTLRFSVENGEVLERNVNGKWVKVLDLKGFLSDNNPPAPPEKYRTVPKETPVDRTVSNLELAKWLAEGYGQVYVEARSVICTDYLYFLEDEHKLVQGLLVRAWGDTEWVVPTASYLGLE